MCASLLEAQTFLGDIRDLGLILCELSEKLAIRKLSTFAVQKNCGATCSVQASAQRLLLTVDFFNLFFSFLLLQSCNVWPLVSMPAFLASETT